LLTFNVYAPAKTFEKKKYLLHCFH